MKGKYQLDFPPIKPPNSVMEQFKVVYIFILCADSFPDLFLSLYGLRRLGASWNFITRWLNLAAVWVVLSSAGQWSFLWWFNAVVDVFYAFDFRPLESITHLGRSSTEKSICNGLENVKRRFVSFFLIFDEGFGIDLSFML